MGTRLLVVMAAVFSFGVLASECSINMEMGVHMTPEKVALLEGKSEKVLIQKGQLLVDGKSVPLDANQKALLTDYEGGIRELTPEVVSLVGNAMEVTMTSVHEVLSGLGGSERDHDKFDETMVKLKASVKQHFVKEGDSYYLSGKDHDSLEQELEQEIEAVVGQVVQASLGNILSNMGAAMASGDGDFTERMEAFGKRMEAMGERIEAEVENSLGDVEAQADALCEKAEALDATETKLHKAVPALKPYELLVI